MIGFQWGGIGGPQDDMGALLIVHFKVIDFPTGGEFFSSKVPSILEGFFSRKVPSILEGSHTIDMT